MSEESQRLNKKNWKKWGPYVSNRQWGTVREDYSEYGDAWGYTNHDLARSIAWRWGEEGIGGISDDQQLLCFAPAFWNGKDAILKEILFGLNNAEGNHGEDVKEWYAYLDSSPTHSYMKMLYKYPQQAFPYTHLVEENKKRGPQQPEYELLDTGVFDENAYFDIFIEYAKSAEEDILIKITAHNRGAEAAPLSILPTLWFRNTWSWSGDPKDMEIREQADGGLDIRHAQLGHYCLYAQDPVTWLFTENETNPQRVHRGTSTSAYYKDAFHRYLIDQEEAAINPSKKGTKAAACYRFQVAAQESVVLRLRLCKGSLRLPFDDFDSVFESRVQDTDAFYEELQPDISEEDERLIHRQALAGLLWNKQFYNYDVYRWLNGDQASPPVPEAHKKVRNTNWKHLNNEDIISMPDKWEFPWYASWDLAFHCVSLALVDPAFAKQQLLMLTKEWYMHPNGQIPAYEWNFDDTNPPVQAWAAWKVYSMEKEQKQGKGDLAFLEAMFQKLLINFTWWVNRKDHRGSNIFSGGFLGLDNIGVFDRSIPLPDGMIIEQADGTSWMAMYALNMMQMSLELSVRNPVYENMTSKFFEHFIHIASALMNIMGSEETGLWDEEDGFFYDQLAKDGRESVPMKLRSIVGLIPLFAVEIIPDSQIRSSSPFTQRKDWFEKHRKDLISLISRWSDLGKNKKHIVSLLRGYRMGRILLRMLDEQEFLSDFGIRSLSKTYEQHPYEFQTDYNHYSVSYEAGESTSNIFGGNSNWRGPIWLPMNYLILESLLKYHEYYGDDYQLEYPTDSGNRLTLQEIAEALRQRLIRLFKRDEQGRRACFGSCEKLQTDPHFRDYLLFHEYFHGDNGKGLGANHQTGWTALIANIIQRK